MEGIIRSRRYRKLQILTHAFLYHEDALSPGDALGQFISWKKMDIFQSLSENIRDIDEFISRREAEKL